MQASFEIEEKKGEVGPRTKSAVLSNMKPDLINGEIYHICYRAVGDSVIFHDVDDHFRGIFSLYELNNSKSVEIWRRRRDRIIEKKKAKLWEVGPPTNLNVLEERDKFVEILCFCFMPNHLHLLVKQLKDNGISNFIQKVGTGYATYFNKKYGRKGHLFNKFKAILIENDNQLKNVFSYIHCNPISLIHPGWKSKKVENISKVIKFLEGYRWGSLQDYMGIKNFPSVTNRELFLSLVDQGYNSKQEIEDWIKYKNEINEATGIFLE